MVILMKIEKERVCEMKKGEEGWTKRDGGK
jgi:hypothetical protein